MRSVGLDTAASAEDVTRRVMQLVVPTRTDEEGSPSLAVDHAIVHRVTDALR